MNFKPVIFSRYIWLLVVSLLTFMVSFGVFIYFLSSTSINPQEAKASTYTKDQIIVAINNQRKQNNLPELIENAKLNRAAQNKANHMAENSYFSHVHKSSGKRWSDFIKESDYDYTVAGENLANGFYTVEDMTNAWMNSPTHKENILNPAVNDTGIGISYGQLDGVPTIFVVQVFGKL